MLEISHSINTPTRIFKRETVSSASATGTDSNGCVQCDEAPTCPDCGPTGDCIQTVQSCTQCPKTYCRSITGSSSSGPNGKTIGGLAGGIIGGLVLLLGLGTFLFYKYYWKKKLVFNRVKHKEFYFDDDIEINFRHHNIDEQLPNQNQSSRNSLATTMFTRASNIIPIAYIPGVTIGPNANKPASDSRASQYSEANTIDSELIGDRYSKASIIGNPSQTTTAIRAKPKLVNIQDQHGNNINPNQDSVPNTAVSASQLGGVQTVKIKDKKQNRYNPGLQTEILEEEESDEGSVQLQPQDQTNSQDYEPFIIDDDDDTNSEKSIEIGQSTPDDKSIRTKRDSVASNGSVLLEVEIDRNPLSPFDDSYELNSKSD
ncbi:hypothetical protein BN7_2305 [Wickerhamomyces ciferrii]|uniref:Membrane anchor Opy2 N-terminal domain-containing protein n=1 Tax=Wickerhamomyces ciferrii (strain ATCC 14091 / BCRC 22168 / CBS 111 / JCM 3599 / NBRC 0793 / NRRL Y-1031 F-60-10) TaxID=1206466 RepID=K0KIG4_WICCF|nr:uncharacterized protein BN7_2305 [Wickerhamomyces ciferrii]CCH42761.1 hypothetical protein BN7_2305 [Wickerhamomyces ciferrii]